MGKLINLIVAGVIFWVVYFYLVPLLGAASGFVGIIVVIIAIVYLLSVLTDYSWPWK